MGDRKAPAQPPYGNNYTLQARPVAVGPAGRHPPRRHWTAATTAIGTHGCGQADPQRSAAASGVTRSGLRAAIKFTTRRERQPCGSRSLLRSGAPRPGTESHECFGPGYLTGATQAVDDLLEMLD